MYFLAEEDDGRGWDTNILLHVHASSKGKILNKSVFWILVSTYVGTPVTNQALVWLARRWQSYHGDFHGLRSTASSTDAFPGSRVTPPACWLKTRWGFAWAKANPKLVSVGSSPEDSALPVPPPYKFSWSPTAQPPNQISAFWLHHSGTLEIDRMSRCSKTM